MKEKKFILMVVFLYVVIFAVGIYSLYAFGVPEAVVNKDVGYQQNMTNKYIAEQNLQFQREANAQNIAFQREINDTNYYRQLQENNLTRQREDTAIQRAAADMQKAGLSKTLAAGHQAGSASMNTAISTAPQVQPLHNDYKHQGVFVNDLGLQKLFEEVRNWRNQNKLVDAQGDNIAAQTAHQNLVNANFTEDLLRKWDSLDNDNALKKAQTAIHQKELEYFDDKQRRALEEMESRINVNKENVELMKRNRDKIVAETVAQLNKNSLFSKEEEKLAYDVVGAKLDYNIRKYDALLNISSGLSPSGAKSDIGRIASDFFNVGYSSFSKRLSSLRDEFF